MSALPVMELEIVRLARRREIVPILGVIAILGGLCFSLGASEGDHPLDSLSAGFFPEELARSLFLLAEAVFLFVAVYFLAQDSLTRDLSSGAFTLVRLTGLRPGAFLIGKALGLSIFALVLHSFGWLFVVPYVPVLRETVSETVTLFLVPWLFAVGYVPEALGSAVAGRVRGATYFFFRIASIARIVFPLAILAALIPADVRRSGIGLSDVVSQTSSWWFGTDPFPPGIFFSHPAMPLLVLVLWQTGTGAIYAWWLARRRSL